MTNKTKNRKQILGIKIKIGSKFCGEWEHWIDCTDLRDIIIKDIHTLQYLVETHTQLHKHLAHF